MGYKFAIHPSQRIVWCWASLAVFLLLTVEFSLDSVMANPSDGVDVVLLSVKLVALMVLLHALLWHESAEYSVDDQEIITSSGVVLKKHERIPLGKIRSLEFDLSRVDQIYGVVDIDINWTGGANPDLTLLHVWHADAHRFANEVTRRQKKLATHEGRCHSVQIQPGF